MTRITPEKFKEAFLKAVQSVNSEIIALWNSRPAYTTLMLKDLLPKVAVELDILVWTSNYYYLDSIFYAERDNDHFGPSATYAKCISIAIEHEHIIDGTAVEMNKLQLFNSPLKVLITYAYNESQREYYLDRYTKILRGADIFGDFATLRRQLVVFGSLSEQIVTWHFYAYEPAGFQVV